MAIITRKFGDGGHNLYPTTEAGSPQLAIALRDIADDLAALIGNNSGYGWADDGVLSGLSIYAPTTPSSQATSTGNTDFNVNISAGECEIQGLLGPAAAVADGDIFHGSFLTGFVVGKSVVAAAYIKNVSGTISLCYLKGAVATTGSETGPTNAQIQTDAGSGNHWVHLGETTLNRTGDVTVTQTYDRSKQGRLYRPYGGGITLKTVKG